MALENSMNRRNFLEGMTSLGAIAARPVTASGTSLPVSREVPRAKWIEDGLIDAGGSHESYSFVVRRGGYRLDARQQYESAQSEALIRRLKDQGVEVFHTHFYKGFGMEAEAAEMRDSVKAAEIAHRLGMRVDTYIQWNTLMYETFFAEEPRAKNWIERDAAGRPILLTYGFQQSFRYRPCFSRHEYLEYLKRVVRLAVEEARTDLIHFDNFDLNPEPDSCHCEACVAGFRERLRRKYSAAERRERFGFENIDYVNPPVWNADNPPGRMREMSDPVIQEWVDCRCQLMADALGEMAAYAKSMNPEVVVEVNPHGITGANRTWENAIDHSRILKFTEVFWSEEQNTPKLLPDGRLISKIRSYKLARTYRNTLLTYISGDRLAAAECLAFNQTIGFAGSDPLTPEVRHYIDFYRRNREYYAGTRDLANVAVLRSYASLTYNHAHAQLAAILTEQTLIQSRIPFDLVFDEHLADLSRYRVLILPESECLSDRELEAIRNFVTAGGGLVAIGQAGLFDQWRRVRAKPGLEGLVDHQLPAASDGPPRRKQVSRGRTAYMPALWFDGPLPESEPYFSIGERYWKFPKNGGDLIESVRWAAREELPVQVSGPASLVANLVEQPQHRRLCLHLVNYNARAAVQDVEVRLELPGRAAAQEVRLISPDTPIPELPAARAEAGRAVFRIPTVKLYSVAVVTW
jgi:hypothetical protein